VWSEIVYCITPQIYYTIPHERACQVLGSFLLFRTIDIITEFGYNREKRSAMYSVAEAAEKLGISDRHLRLLLERGDVKGKKVGHYWVVLRLDYQRKRKPKGGQGNEKS
jgi:hypothetical protein